MSLVRESNYIILKEKIPFLKQGYQIILQFHSHQLHQNLANIIPIYSELYIINILILGQIPFTSRPET